MIWRNRQLFMSNVTLTGSICLTVFLFIVLVYFRLLNFSLFFIYVVLPHNYVGEIKLYILLSVGLHTNCPRPR